MYKIAYDPEVKILKIRLKPGKSVDSDIKGNVILDYDKSGNLVKLEVMDVNLEEVMHKSTSKKRRAVAR